MNLTSPLTSLIPSLDSAVLDVLVGTEAGLSATRIHRLAARGSRQGVTLVLDRMMETGLVSAEPANTGHLYRLNRDHLLAPAVLLAAASRKAFLDRLSEAAHRLVPPPVSVSLFGSTARKESGETSDIDVLFIVENNVDPDSERWTEQLHRLADDVLRWSGNRLESVVFTRSHLRNVVDAGEPIVAEWRADALHLYGLELGPILDGRGGAAE